MQFVSGTNNLVDTTRLYAGDPDAAPRTTWTDAEVKLAVNQAYGELREAARIMDVGHARKITSLTTVASTATITAPTDLIALITAEVDTLGTDLSATDTVSTNSVFLKITDSSSALALYHSNQLSGPEFIAVQEANLLLVDPVSTGGANALRILYDAETADLSADADEPVLPTHYHYLLCMIAAVLLKSSRGKDVSDLQALVDRRMPMFLAAMHENVRDYEVQVKPAAFVDQDWANKFGSMG